MKRLGIAMLLVLVALRGAGAAWAVNGERHAGEDVLE